MHSAGQIACEARCRLCKPGHVGSHFGQSDFRGRRIVILVLRNGYFVGIGTTNQNRMDTRGCWQYSSWKATKMKKTFAVLALCLSLLTVLAAAPEPARSAERPAAA